MEKQESPTKNRLEELLDIIKKVSISTDKEFRNTANSWLACLASSVDVIDVYLGMPKVIKLLPVEKNDLAQKRIEELKEKLTSLKEQYPDKNTVPPEEIRQQLLKEVDVFREEKQK